MNISNDGDLQIVNNMCDDINLLKQIKGFDKDFRFHVFSLWHSPVSTDIDDNEVEEAFVITCTIDGEEAACSNWRGYDYEAYKIRQDAEKELKWWRRQLH